MICAFSSCYKDTDIHKIGVESVKEVFSQQKYLKSDMHPSSLFYKWFLELRSFEDKILSTNTERKFGSQYL